MADTQVALSRITRAASGSLSKATRQAVPPFLQKLYEMVSDSATDSLIRWSENGDSFFVLDHERVAHDVLPRWFKHSNFASFVRQLNMYGFHKIPHLQQGVLKSETETEIWNFEHANFRRGQPDLLCLITRKKQAQDRQGDDMSLGEKESNPPGVVGGFTPGSLVDINSIINGIAAIKRHQATISADLNDLKTSNQHLWQEALDARERHQKQQDTINRILKFLAGVFGSAGAHKGSPHGSPASIPRKRQRLMIEGAAQSEKERPLEPLDGVESMVEDDEESKTTDRFIEVLPSPAPSKASSVVHDTSDPQNRAPQFQSNPPLTADIVMGGNFPNQQSFVPFPNTFPPSNGNSASYTGLNDPVTPTALTSSTPSGAREELLQSIVNSPGSLQRLLTLLNFQQQQQNIPMPPPLDLNDSRGTADDSSNGYIDSAFDPFVHPSYQPASDPTLSMPSNFDIVEPDSQTMSLLQTDDMPGISFDPYIENANRLKKTSDASSVITEHVNMMDSNIESLIKQLGLDPQQLDNVRDDSEFGGGTEGDNDALFNHDQTEQQQQQQLPNLSSSSTVSSGPSTNGISTNASAPSDSNVTTNTVPFQSTIPEFDFSVFLNELAKHNSESPGGPGFSDYKPENLDALVDNSKDNLKTSDPTISPQLSAFVDEIASQSGHSDISSPPRTRASISSDITASPTPNATSLPDIPMKKAPVGGVRKRKSDVDSLDNDARAQTKAKRKR